MLKILQAKLQQYMNQEHPDVQVLFRKGRGTRNQTADICWIIEKAREFQKSNYFCFTDYSKAFDCVDRNHLWKILKETGIPDHPICLLRNLYAHQEPTACWFNKGLVQNWERSTYVKAVYCHPAYLTYMQGTSCEMMSRLKLESRLRGEISTSDMQMTPPLLAESEEELKSLLMKVKEGSKKFGLKFNIQKTKIMASGPSLHGK